MITLLQYIISFMCFVLLQSLFINGVNACFKEGMIFYKIGQLFKGSVFYKPIVSCIKCMSSFWGGITFITSFIYLFGFGLVMIPLLIFDMFILVTVNWLIYKKS